MSKKPAPSSKDQGQLSIQIDTCADHMADLISATRNKMNEAMAAGDLDAADHFDQLNVEQTVQYATMVRHEIKKIDDSDLMRQTIKGFADASASIDGLIKANKQFTEFLSAARSIASIVQSLIGIALVAAG